MQDRNSCIDFFKGISCIAVILIHCRFPGMIGGALRAVARFAVPFFFTVSGYFLYKQNQSSNIQIIKGRLKKTVTLLISAELFYVLYYIITNVCVLNAPITTIFDEFTVSKLMRFIIDNSPMLYPHLWYIYALVYCYGFVAFVEYGKFGYRWRNLYCIIAFGYYFLFSEVLPRFGINDVFTSWQFSIHNTFFVRALPFLLLGAIIHEHEDRIKNISISPMQSLCLFITLCLTSVFERIAFSDSGVYLSSIAIVLLFWIVSINKICRVNKGVSFVGNKLSTDIYIIHISIMNVFDMIYASFGIDKYSIIAWIKPFVVIFSSLIVSWLLYEIKKSIRERVN